MEEQTACFSGDPEEERSLLASIKEGMCQAIMLGAGETYLNAFAIFLKASALQIGLLAATPQLIGGIFQLCSVWIQERIGSRRQFLITVVKLQATVWLLIALLPYLFNSPNKTVGLLIFCIILYYACQGLFLPVWSSLIGDIVPPSGRGFFFGMRSGRISLVTFVSLFIAGQTLHSFESIKWTAAGFTAIFLLAGAARLLSIRWLKLHLDPSYQISATDHFTLFDFLRRLPHSNFARFVLFFSLMNLAVWFSSPFFAVYMLRVLELDYFTFTLLTAAATFSQILTLQRWGKLSDRFGNKRILNLSAIGVAFVPFLWLFSSSILYLTAVQLLAGFIWAGFNLSSSNFLFDAVTPPKRGRCVAYQAVLNGLSIMIGALSAGFLLKHINNPIPFEIVFDVPATPFLTIIFISGCLRVLTVGKFLASFKEVREVEWIRNRDLIFEILHVRALSGLAFRPIWPTRNEAEKKKPGTS